MSEIQPQCVRCPRQCDYNILRLTPTSLLRSSVLLNRYPPRFSGARLRYHPDHSNILSSGRGFTVDRGVYCTFLPKKDYSVTDLCFQRLILVVYDLSLSLSLSLSLQGMADKAAGSKKERLKVLQHWRLKDSRVSMASCPLLQ